MNSGVSLSGNLGEKRKIAQNKPNDISIVVLLSSLAALGV